MGMLLPDVRRPLPLLFGYKELEQRLTCSGGCARERGGGQANSAPSFSLGSVIATPKLITAAAGKAARSLLSPVFCCLECRKKQSFLGAWMYRSCVSKARCFLLRPIDVNTLANIIIPPAVFIFYLFLCISFTAILVLRMQLHINPAKQLRYSGLLAADIYSSSPDSTELLKSNGCQTNRGIFPN